MNKYYKKLFLIVLAVFIATLQLSFSSLKTRAASMTSSEFYQNLAKLQNAYPNGTNCSGVYFYYNNVKLGEQCHGYARMATGWAFGDECKNGINTTTWVRYNATATNSQIDKLAIGDMVRFNNGPVYDHTIFVTDISGDTITYTDCNGAGDEKVRWNVHISKKDLSAKLVLKLHENSNCGWFVHYTGSPFGGGISEPPSNIAYPGSSGFTYGGTYWWNAPGYGINGTMKYTYCNGNTRDSWGRWSFNLSAIKGNGYYKVEAYIPNNNATTGNARYQIFHAGKTDYKAVNQNNYYNAWVDLGTYDFTSDKIAAIELDDATGETYVNTGSPKVGFDAVRLTFVSAIDTEAPSGSWITPVNGGKVYTSGSIKLSVNASDNKGVSKVVFNAYYDGQWHELGTDSHGGNGTYNLTWNYDITPQNIEFHAHLYDTSNNWKNILGPIVTFSKPVVSFNTQGGSSIESITADYNSTITEPSEPTKEEYNFGGWYKEVECLNAWNFKIDQVTADTILYAKWTHICDIDKDGAVSIVDLASVAQNYNTMNKDEKWNSSFDFNKDGIVDIFDLVFCSKRI